MTDNDIIKALDGCISSNCTECPHNTEDGCTDALMQNAIDLIDRQRMEISRLEKILNTDFCFIGSRANGKTEMQRQIIKVRADEIKIRAVKEFWLKLQQTVIINNTHDGYMDFAIDWNCLVDDGNEIVKEMEDLANENESKT